MVGGRDEFVGYDWGGGCGGGFGVGVVGGEGVEFG